MDGWWDDLGKVASNRSLFHFSLILLCRHEVAAGVFLFPRTLPIWHYVCRGNFFENSAVWFFVKEDPKQNWKGKGGRRCCKFRQFHYASSFRSESWSQYHFDLSPPSILKTEEHFSFLPLPPSQCSHLTDNDSGTIQPVIWHTCPRAPFFAVLAFSVALPPSLVHGCQMAKFAPPRPPPWRNPRKGRDQILQRSVAEP